MMSLKLGAIEDWKGVIIPLLGLIIPLFGTIWYRYKDNRKTWKTYKNIEFKRIFPESGVEYVTNDIIIVISCYNNGKVPIFLELNKVVKRRKFILSKIAEEYPRWAIDLDIDRHKKIEIKPSKICIIYRVDLKYISKFYENNKSKLKKFEDFCFCIEELEGKREYIKINDILKK